MRLMLANLKVVQTIVYSYRYVCTCMYLCDSFEVIPIRSEYLNKMYMQVYAYIILILTRLQSTHAKQISRIVDKFTLIA